MASLEDDLPPPPPKRAIKLDDDDDLPPPPSQPQKPTAITLDDDDDDLPPPPPKKNVVELDDSEDDLPIPAAGSNSSAVHTDPVSNNSNISAGAGATPPTRPRAVAVATAPASPQQGGQAQSPQKEPAADKAAPLPTQSPATAPPPAGRKKTHSVARVNSLSKEGFLFKQSPTWPYTSQKRWCVLKGRLLNYYEAQTSKMPAGTLDLKGAQLIDVAKSAKMSNSFGLTGSQGMLKGRTFIFSAPKHEEFNEWVEIIKLVVAEPTASEIHWFEKMAQGVF